MTGETKMEQRLRELETAHTETRTLLVEHVKSCDKRGELMLKVVWWALFGILIIAVEQTFNIHVPGGLPAL